MSKTNPTPQPAQVPPLVLPTDVATKMKTQGYNPDTFNKEMASLQAAGKQDEALRNYGLIIDRHRGPASNAFGQLSKASVDASSYQQTRTSQGANESLSGWDDFGRSFYNGAVVRLGQGIHMLGTAIPKAIDGAVNNNSDWLKDWQDANAAWYDNAKLFTTPQAEAGIFDKNGDVNWRGVSGTMGNTLGMMAATFLPLVGVAGRAGNALRGASMLGRLGSTAAQSGAIGFLQMLPMYTQEARKAGYTPTQSMMASIPLAAVQGMLEHFGMDIFTKSIGLGTKEASTAMRALRQETAKEAFQQLAGRELSTESFKEVSELMGKGFIERLRQPETLRRLASNIAKGAAEEGGEEFIQSWADYGIKGLFDEVYGNSKPGDGKGFDMSWQDAAKDAAIGTLLGGTIGGTMGGIFGALPSSFQQQTLFGKVDDDVRFLLGKGGSLLSGDPQALQQAKQNLSSYKLLNRAHQNGEIDDETFQNSTQKLDAMARVSEQLARTGVSSPTARYALYDLNNRQTDFQAQFDQQITQPLKRLNELATPQSDGSYQPKPGLPVLERAEANQLIAQNLPQRQQLGQQIGAKIDDYVSRLVNPDSREEAARKYGSDIEADLRLFEQTGQPQQTRFSENELSGLTATMETPKGRFAIRHTADPTRPREVVQVQTAVQGEQTTLSEDRDATIGRFRGFKLPTKGKPVVSFSAVDEATQGQLLDSFDSNPDLVEPYNKWRGDLQQKFTDDPLTGLRAAKSAVDSEAARLASQPAPTDWERSDLIRKRDWVRSGFQQIAENPADLRYNPDNYIADHHADWLEANGIDAGALASLPATYQNGIYDALSSGNEAEATRLATAAIPLNQLLNPDDTESSPSSLLAEFENENGRVARRQIVDQLAQALSGRAAVFQSVSDYLAGSQPDADVERRLAGGLAELAAYQQQLADAIEQILGEESSDADGTAAGDQPAKTAKPTRSRSTGGKTNSDGTASPSRANLVKGYDPLSRQPQSLQEAILQYFAGKGRVRTDDVKRYGDPNWMKGAKGGNPLISYITSDPASAQPLDNLARQLSEGFPEAADEQAVMQQIMDVLSGLPGRPPKGQLLDLQQQPVEQQLGEQVPQYTPLQVLGGLFEAMDRAGIDNTRQEALIRTIESDHVTADGLDWLGVYNLLGFNGFLKESRLKEYVFGEYLNQVAAHVSLTPEQEALAASLTPSEIKELMDGGPLSDEVFQLIMENGALTEEQANELNSILGAENPTPVNEQDVPILYPDPAGESRAATGDEEGSRAGPDGQSQQAPPASSASQTLAEPQPAETAVAESPQLEQAVQKATAAVDLRVAGLDAKIRQQEAKVDNLKRQAKKRVTTAPIEFGVSAQPVVPPPTQPAGYFSTIGKDNTGVSVPVAESLSPTASVNTTLIAERAAGGYNLWPADSSVLGGRVDRLAINGNYLDPYFTKANAPIGPTTNIITLVPAKISDNGTVIEKGKVFYETAAKKYSPTAGLQTDLSEGQITGLEAEQAAKNGIAQAEAELSALRSARENEAATREKVAELARQNALAQTSLFSENVPPTVPQSVPEAAPSPGIDQKLTELQQQEADLAAKLKEKMRQMRNNLSSNPFADPEFLSLGAQYLGVKFQQGVYKFAQVVRDFVSLQGPINADELSALKTAYGAYQNTVDDDTFDRMDDARTVRRIQLDEVNRSNQEANDQRTPTSLEPDSPRVGTTDGLGPQSLQPDESANRPVAGPATQTSPEAAAGQPGDLGLSNDIAPVTGEPGNQSVRAEQSRGPGITLDLFAGAYQRGGSSTTGNTGVQPQRSPADAVSQTPSANAGATTPDKLTRQAQADRIPVVVGDRANIDATLPFLMEGQREDVHFAETRFAKPDGFGVLFTNGTGTGKTFLGLGIAKRFVKQGKKDGIIVVPNDAVMNEWVKSAPALGLTITPLTSTKDKGRGLAITTFANFGQNDEIAKRPTSFVIIDEAQNLMQSSGADNTAALNALRAITLHPDSARALTDMQHRDWVNRIDFIKKQVRKNTLRMNNLDLMDSVYDELQQENSDLESEQFDLEEKYRPYLEANKALIERSQNEARPRVTFLSATPFAYRENIQWAENYLFKYPDVTSRGYNTPSAYGQFMINHFGYRMRTGKLTKPEAEVDSNLMERQFNSHLREQGVLSARVLDIDSDYQRLFALTPSAVGAKIDEGLTWLREAEEGRYRSLYEVVNKRFDYLERQRLLEAIKAKEAIPLIQQWHQLGKKVVVFYDYNQGGGFSPFELTNSANVPILITKKDGSTGETIMFKDLVAEFAAKRPDLIAIDTKLPPPLEALRAAFPKAGVINGMPEFKKNKIQSIRDFNDDSKPGANILLVQSAANSGWSGHDTTGKHKRVLLNLGMPTAPTKAIQQEGRVYRNGQHPESDSVFAYLNTGTGWERIAFGSTISSRASTAENLAMGQMARGLKDAFIQAFEESEVYTPSQAEGKGSKAKDRALVQAISDFDRARALYYANEKKNSRTKAMEGTDYFATPEPVGLKLVEWAGIKPGEDVLEPSAGHGAIARWFPDDTKKVIVEPSFDLASRASLVTDARLVNERFEDFSIQNKFDAIVMNPPFGTAGKTASDHVQKAAMQHLRNGGRLLAIVPTGSFNDKFEKWFYGTDAKGKPIADNLHLSARILLPGSAFERAGTSVRTQILVIDRNDDPAQLQKYPSTQNLDFTDSDNIKDFFERIKDLSIRERPALSASTAPTRQPIAPISTPASSPVSAPAGVPAAPIQAATEVQPTGDLKPPLQGKHSKYGTDIFTVQVANRMEYGVFKDRDALARSKYDGYYSKFTGNGAIPGFIFKTAETANGFYREITGQDPPAQMQYGTAPQAVPVTGQLLDSLQSFLPNAKFANRLEGTSFDQAAFDQAAQAAGLPKSDKLTGFRVGDQIYLNPSRLNGQTALHELGHVWASAMRAQNPAVLDRGLALMAGTRYETKFKTNPAYAKREDESQTDYVNRIREEALVEAIADKGAKLLSSTNQSKFRQFLTDFWNGVKKLLKQAGITIESKAKSLADATLDDYTQAIASQMIEGQPAIIQPTAQTAPTDRVDAQFQMPATAARPIVNPDAQAIASFRAATETTAFRKSLKAMSVSDLADTLQNAYGPVVSQLLQLAPRSLTVNRLTKPRSIGPFKGAPGTLFDGSTGQFSPAMLEDVAKLVKGKPIQYGALTKSLRDLLLKGQVSKDWHEAAGGADTYIDADGNYVDADIQTETQDLNQSLDTIAQHAGPWGFLTRLLNTKAAGALTLPETIAHWLSGDAQSALRTALIETRRAWVARAAELGLSRQQQIDSLTTQFAGISLFDGRNPASQVATLERAGYADGNAKAIKLPVAVWMHMIATHRSQQQSHNGRSSVVADLDPSGQLIKSRYDADGKPQAYGYDYTDPLTDKTTTYLVDSATLDKVEAELNASHKTAFEAAKDFFKFEPALDYLKGLHRSISGEELVLYKDYFPTVSTSTQSDPLTSMPRLLKDAKILQAREGLPMRVRGGDMLAELQAYARREEHYVGNVATLVNLQRWQKRHGTTLLQKAPRWVSDYLDELEIDLNDPTARARQQGNWTEVKIGGVDVGLRAMLRRFTTSVFSVAPALPLKQITTMLQGVGLGIVENKYLAQASLHDLAPLFVQAYHVARQNDEKAIYGTDLKESGYLSEMAQNPYLATVLSRAVGRSEAFIGRPSMDDLKANPASAVVGGARKVLHTVADFGLGAVRRSDRAVLLSFWKAAQYQTQADIAAGTLTDENGMPITDMTSEAALKRVADLTERLVYDTNQMSSESDRTPLQRDRSLISTLIGLYSGQQQRLVNTFMQKYADWLHTPDGPAKQEAFNNMAWVGFNNILLNAALMAVISLMWRLVQKAITGDDRPEEYGQTLAWDTARGVLGSFPSLPTEALVMLTTMTDNQKWSSGLIEYAPGEAVAQTISGLQQAVSYVAEDDEAKKVKLLNQLTYNLADGTTKLSGLPNNLSRLLAKLAKQKKPVSQAEWDQELITE